MMSDDYEDAARHILEVILRRRHYSSETLEKVSSYMKKAHREVEILRIKREAQLLLKQTKIARPV